MIKVTSPEAYTQLFAKLDKSDLEVPPADALAWNNPDRHSYHSFHVERLTDELFYVRESTPATYYIVTLAELTDLLATKLRKRKLDPQYEERMNSAQVLNLLSQSEIDDLLGDL